MRVTETKRSALIAIFTLLAMVLVACPPREPAPEEAPVPEPMADQDPGEANEEVVVGMSANRFEPGEVTVRVGQSVRWRNGSTVEHTVTADPELAADPDNVEVPSGAENFHSGAIAPGEEYTQSFTVAGTYRYICVPHEAMGMVGTITVSDDDRDDDG